MCAAALASLAPARVVFGCANDRFGGCGSVAAMHEAGVEAAVACGGGKEAPSAPSRRGFPPTPGLRAADAVALLQAFYESGNPAAPVPRRAVVPVVVPE
jgi:tRNA-specific adenosine deaminase 2